jgi:hypothetical protein
MRGRHWVLGAAVTISTAAAFDARPASAAIIPYTQLSENRDISLRDVVSGPDGDMLLTDGESSNALGTFFRSMAFDQTGRPSPDATPHAAVSADQGVVFGETSIFGSVGMNLRISGNPTAGGTARSITDTQFTVAQPTPYTLSGRVRMNADAPRSQGSFVIRFNLGGTGPAGETEQIASALYSSPPTSGFGATIDEPLSAAGTLLPGWTYGVDAFVAGDAGVSRFYDFEQFIDGRIDFALTVPEPAAVGFGVLAAGMLLARRRRAGGFTAASA